MSQSTRKATILTILLAAVFACGPRSPLATPGASTPAPIQTASPTPTPVPNPPGQIAFGSSTFTGDSQVVLMDLQTGNVSSLTAGYPGEYYRPVFSPDGGRLAMREEISMDGGGIAVMEVRMEGGRPAGSAPAEVFHGFADGPTWSPDGSRVAFVSTHETGNWTAYTADLFGSPPAQIPGIPQRATDLAWSPDGAWIAFSYYEDTAKQVKDLYKIHPDGTGLTRLTNTPDADESGAAWSPDSLQIAFSGRSRTEAVGQGDIYRMNADGSGLVRVTSDDASEFDPAWSPDGNQIAYTSTRHEANDGNYEIYLVNADGSGELRLTNNRTTDRWPTWRRTPAGTDYGVCAPEGEFAAHVTIPAGTRFTGPQEFTKVWRVRNSGACAWPPAGYGLRFGGGATMSGAAYLPVSGAIQPGDSVDMALPLVAPAASGSHSGSWVLFDNTGRAVPAGDGLPLTLSASVEVLAEGARVLPSPLYFLSDRSGRAQIWRMETDGATLAQITDETEGVRTFAVSAADGSIAFLSRTEIILVGRDGTGRRAIADIGERYAGGLAFSPDGRLAYALDGVRVFDPVSGEDRLLIADNDAASPADFAKYYPRAWSPDGSKLLVMIGRYEWAEAGILSADGALLASGEYSHMSAWTNDSQAVLLASAVYPMMGGMNPGLAKLSAAGASSALVSDSFVWWPCHRPDGRLAYFVSRPAGMEVTEYAVRMVSAAADGSGETPLLAAPLILDYRDSFTALWSADAETVLVWIYRKAAEAGELLLIPAGDQPPVFLMQQTGSFAWDDFPPDCAQCRGEA
ncbi:MAG: PD40 domain-containing protein [Anaerolineales bacterium]|nr:PD40 domain-containing protein [Anaerolineales bacterium]